MDEGGGSNLVQSSTTEREPVSPSPVDPPPVEDTNTLKRRADRRRAILERRRRAWNLKLAGTRHDDIARMLGITKRAVTRHLAKAEAEYAKELGDEINRWRQQEVARCDALIQALWPNKSNPRHTDSINRIMERRARLLGVDAPVKAEIAGRGGGPIGVAAMTFDPTKLTIEQLRQLDELLSVAAKSELPVGDTSSGEIIQTANALPAAPVLQVVRAQDGE